MRTPERVTLMKRYFTVYDTKYPNISKLLIVALSVLVFGLFIIYAFQNTWIAGIIAIVLGISLFIIWIRPFYKHKNVFKERPKIEQMNNWLIADLNEKVKERACELLRLNMSDLNKENFLIIPCPVYWAEGGVKSKSIRRREAERDKFIYTVWTVQVVALSKNYISFFNCIYDWVGNKIINEKTDEYFYDDIVSVKNDVRKVEKRFIDQAADDESKQELTEYILKITNVSSESRTIVTHIPEMGYSSHLEVDIEKAMQALRITLRNRRYKEEQDPIILEVERPKED